MYLYTYFLKDNLVLFIWCKAHYMLFYGCSAIKLSLALFLNAQTSYTIPVLQRLILPYYFLLSNPVAHKFLHLIRVWQAISSSSTLGKTFIFALTPQPSNTSLLHAINMQLFKLIGNPPDMRHRYEWTTKNPSRPERVGRDSSLNETASLGMCVLKVFDARQRHLYVYLINPSPPAPLYSVNWSKGFQCWPLIRVNLLKWSFNASAIIKDAHWWTTIFRY